MGWEKAKILVRGQVQIQQPLFCFAKSMALKCVIEIRMLHIIKSHGSER